MKLVIYLGEMADDVGDDNFRNRDRSGEIFQLIDLEGMPMWYINITEDLRELHEDKLPAVGRWINCARLPWYADKSHAQNAFSRKRRSVFNLKTHQRFYIGG